MRPAFARSSTFLWFAVALAATCVRPDLRGVTRFVRVLGLTERCYGRLLGMFHSTAVWRVELPARWSRLAPGLPKPLLFCVNHRIVLLADGIKAPKTGRKMPGGKKLHQESRNNSKPAGRAVRFVLVIHPTRGRRIFLCTDTTLDGIEVVRRKLGAYHCFLQMGVIEQGLLEMLAILYPDTVWRRFGSWLRTVRPGVAPSGQVVALAWRECLPESIAGYRKTNPLAKIISENLGIDRAEGWRLAS